MAFSAEYIYRILDQYSGPLRKITAATARFQDKAAASSRSINRMSDRLGAVSSKMSSFGAAIGGAALTAGMFKFAQGASTMSDAMADVARVTGLAGPELAAMQERFQKLGRATGRNAEGLAAMAYEGGKLGIANDQLVQFVEGVMKTAVAFDMADTEAGRAIGSIRAKLGLSVASVDQLMQRVNFLADNTSANGAQMINIIERTSGTFASLSIPPEVTAGWAAFANQVEVTPELAASGLNMMMRQMMKMPGMMEKMLKDPKNAVVNFLKRFESIPEAKRGTLILKTFGDEAGRFVMKAVAQTKLLDTAMQTAASSKALGSMDREFANIMQRSSTAGARFKQTLIDISRAVGAVFIKVFDKYSASLIKGTDAVLAFVKAHPGLVKMAGVIAALLAGISAVVVPLGILISLVGAALPVLAGLAGTIGAISWPVVALVAGITLLTTAFVGAWYKSAALRESLSNLANAFSPIIELVKPLFLWIGEKLGGAFGATGSAMELFGNIAAVQINMVATMLKTLITIITQLGGFWKDVFTGDVMGLIDRVGGWGSGLLDKIGFGSAKDKADSRQDNKMEFSGKIDVFASGGAGVKSADIGLNVGQNWYNMAAW